MGSFTYSNKMLRKHLFAAAQQELEKAKEEILQDAVERIKEEGAMIMVKYALKIEEQESMSDMRTELRIELGDGSK